MMISQVGQDLNGRELLEEIKKLGINSSYIFETADVPTSTVEVQVAADGQVSYEIVEQVAWDYIPFDAEIAQTVQQASAFVFGSLAARSPISRETLLKYIQYAPWPVFDINLRRPYFDEHLIIDLIGRSKTLKLNEEELHIVANWLQLEEKQADILLPALLSQFLDLEEIIYTKGPEGASYCNRKEQFSVPGLVVKVKDTVGSGDSFLGTFIAKRAQGASAQDALTAAIQISAYVASCDGACPPYPNENI